MGVSAPMGSTDVTKLAELVRLERQSLLDAWRRQVRDLPSARNLDTPTLNDHIPVLIEEIAVALRSPTDATISGAIEEGSPPAHGVQRYQDGFDIEEVVAEYNILRGCLHDLADRHGLNLQGQPFHVLNRVLDGAIGSAVQAFAAQRAQEVQQRRQEYLAFVAHDLRTPLNAVALAMNFLERGPNESGSRAENDVLWKILRRNVQQLESLVSKIMVENINLEVEAGLKLAQRQVDLWALVETVRVDLQLIAEKAGATLVNAIPEDIIAFIDASMVRRIFQNLIVNAVSFAPEGMITLGARRLDEGTAVECFVRDNGAGIPADRLASVFDKMESSGGDGSNGSGVGLGLAIVKAFVEAHGGQVSVDSRDGEGTTFKLTLPALHAA